MIFLSSFPSSNFFQKSLQALASQQYPLDSKWRWRRRRMIWMSMATRRRNLVLSSITRRMSSRGVPPARLKTPATSATRITSAITSSSKGALETRQRAIVITNQKPRPKLKLKTRVWDMLDFRAAGSRWWWRAWKLASGNWKRGVETGGGD